MTDELIVRTHNTLYVDKIRLIIIKLIIYSVKLMAKIILSVIQMATPLLLFILARGHTALANNDDCHQFLTENYNRR